jgi:KDO2-lipid IV(A) lauroyltransferase
MPNSHDIPKPPLGVRFWPGWLAIGFTYLLGKLPHRLQLALGRGCVWLVQPLLKRRLAIARINIKRCFPHFDRQQQNTLLREHRLALGEMLAQQLFAWWCSARRFAARQHIQGLDAVQKARQQGAGIIILSGHFTTLEVGGRALAGQLPIAALYRSHKTPLMEFLVRWRRIRNGIGLFRRRDTRPLVRYLRTGGVLWYAPDQDYTHGERVFVPFFGIETNTITSAHQLARFTGAKVFMLSQQCGRGQYYYQLKPLPQIPSDDAHTDCALINAEIEDQVRDCPSQYLWIHRRFKTRPPGEPPFYPKRK